MLLEVGSRVGSRVRPIVEPASIRPDPLRLGSGPKTRLLGYGSGSSKTRPKPGTDPISGTHSDLY